MINKIIEIMEEIFGTKIIAHEDKEITPDNIEGWDSLTHLQLSMVLEEEFGVELTPDDIDEMFKGIESIINVLNRYEANK